jgi:hypothetical protein
MSSVVLFQFGIGGSRMPPGRGLTGRISEMVARMTDDAADTMKETAARVAAKNPRRLMRSF